MYGVNLMVNKYSKFLYIIIILFSLYSVFPQENPFFSNPDKPADTEQVEKEDVQEKRTVQQSKAWRKFVIFMAKLNTKLSSYLTKLDDNFNMKHYLILIGIAFIYGFLHAAGPGHGKTIIFSYFLGNKTSYGMGARVSVVIGVMHTVMGMVLAVLFSTVFYNIKGADQMKVQWILGLASGIMIMAVGIILLIVNLRHKHDHGHGHSHGEHKCCGKHDHGHSHGIEGKLTKKLEKKGIYGLAVAAGLVPCPMTLAVALFSFAQGYIFIGISAIIAISIGMSLLLVIVTTITIATADLSFYNKFIENNKFSGIFHYVLHIGSSALIVMIGLFLILAAYGINVGT